jgi:hypothetical protein
MAKMPNITPGEILLEEFLKPYNISAYIAQRRAAAPHGPRPCWPQATSHARVTLCDIV